MKIISVRPAWVVSMALLTLILGAASRAEEAKPKARHKNVRAEIAPSTDEEKTLYSLGSSIGKSLTDFQLTPQELNFVIEGLNDRTLHPGHLAVNVSSFTPKINLLVQRRRAQKAELEKKKIADFIAGFASQPGAVKLSSGAVFVPIAESTGPVPGPTDRIKAHFRGASMDGKVFDDTHDRQSPVVHQVNRTIPCWAEGLQKMHVGGKAKLVCPPAAAYGDSGKPPEIPPKSVLVFDVELLSAEKTQK